MFIKKVEVFAQLVLPSYSVLDGVLAGLCQVCSQRMCWCVVNEQMHVVRYNLAPVTVSQSHLVTAILGSSATSPSCGIDSAHWQELLIRHGLPALSVLHRPGAPQASLTFLSAMSAT